ncbi:MAG TPA: DoxX family protein [Jiangellales bacterium]|nr:DoxX family protein [Jiangellales bacterium]
MGATGGMTGRCTSRIVSRPGGAPAVTTGQDGRMGAPGWRTLAALLATAGTAHFVTPRPFERIVPRALGDPGPWVVASGVAELACALALVPPRTRRLAALATAGLFVAVYPGNVQQALDAARGPRWYRAAAWARLPAQVPLVLWALEVARREGPPRGSPTATPTRGPTARAGSRPPRAGARAAAGGPPAGR